MNDNVKLNIGIVICLGVILTAATATHHSAWGAFGVWMIFGIGYQIYDYRKYWEYVKIEYKNSPLAVPLMSLATAVIWPIAMLFDHSGLY